MAPSSAEAVAQQGQEIYDVVFDTVGRTSMRDVRTCLAPRGRYLATVFGFRDWLGTLWSSLWRGQRRICGASNFYWKREDLDLLKDMLTRKQLRPVIDRTFPWLEAAQAHRYVEEGHKRGNVVLIVS